MELLLKLLSLTTHGFLAYGAIFAVLVACGLGVPLPEDISLILGGFLAHQGQVHLLYMMAVGFCGILAGDTLIFFAGRRVGKQALTDTGFLSRVVTPERRAKVERLFGRHGEKIVMMARFMPGVRAVTYFTAGSAGMRYPRFIMFDGLAALGSAPLFVFLGYHFGAHIEFVVNKVRKVEELQAGAVVVLALLLMVSMLMRRRRANSGEPELGPLRSPSSAETTGADSGGGFAAVAGVSSRFATTDAQPMLAAPSRRSAAEIVD